MTRHIAQTILDSQLGSLQLWVDGDVQHSLFTGFSHKAQLLQQCGENLGERLWHSFNETLAESDAAIVVGSDCPFIDKKYLEDAYKALESADAVLGPACDGGYVLLGIKKAEAKIFEGIEWGSDRVLQQTLAKFQGLGLSVILLDMLPDIDRPEDLALLNDPALPQSLAQFASKQND